MFVLREITPCSLVEVMYLKEILACIACLKCGKAKTSKDSHTNKVCNNPQVVRVHDDQFICTEICREDFPQRLC